LIKNKQASNFIETFIFLNTYFNLTFINEMFSFHKCRDSDASNLEK